MNSEHWLQLAIALITPVLTLTMVMVGFLYNNSRFSDLRTDLRDLVIAHSEKQDANLRRVEDMLLNKFAELDSRLSRLESRK
ncbi:MAG: hypothetical protein HY822_17560 [Acidobacteria bacterium]|nr:hypothetical protein [Acidobacteriota bacterium]